CMGSGSIAAGQAPAPGGFTDQAAPPRRLAVGRGDFARFQELFEATQVLLDLGLRILSQQFGESRGQTPAHRPIVDTEPDYSAAPTWGSLKENRTCVGDLRCVDRAPRESRSRPILGDLAVPLRGNGRDALGDPVETPLVQLLDRLQVVHEARQVLDVPPEPIALIRGLDR